MRERIRRRPGFSAEHMRALSAVDMGYGFIKQTGKQRELTKRAHKEGLVFLQTWRDLLAATDVYFRVQGCMFDMPPTPLVFVVFNLNTKHISLALLPTRTAFRILEICECVLASLPLKNMAAATRGGQAHVRLPTANCMLSAHVWPLPQRAILKFLLVTWYAQLGAFTGLPDPSCQPRWPAVKHSRWVSSNQLFLQVWSPKHDFQRTASRVLESAEVV